jgi:hypothetical protein
VARAWNEGGRVQVTSLYSPEVAPNKEEEDWEEDSGIGEFGKNEPATAWGRR